MCWDVTQCFKSISVRVESSEHEGTYEQSKTNQEFVTGGYKHDFPFRNALLYCFTITSYALLTNKEGLEIFF